MCYREEKRASGILRIIVAITNISLAAIIGTILLVCVYMLPIDIIEENVEKSAYIIQQEGTYPRVIRGFTSQLDNWTDSIMLLIAADDSIQMPLFAAMLNSRGYIQGKNNAEALVSNYLDGVEYDGEIQYPRYWHGYLFFLKSLLCFTNYKIIRIINGILQLFLVMVISYLLYKKGQKLAMVAYLICYCMLMPLALAMCMQFSACFYVFSFGCIRILSLTHENILRKGYIVFLYCGIMTAFFDLLTYPIATFGVTMTVYLLLTNTDSMKNRIVSIFSNGFYWGLGYACMWGAKWILASAITGNNYIADGMYEVLRRTSSYVEEVSYSRIYSEFQNYKAFLKTPFSLFAIAFVGYMLYRNSKRGRHSVSTLLKGMAPFIIVAVVPILWYALAVNHSVIHFWFTNKACVVSVMAVMFGLISIDNQNACE